VNGDENEERMIRVNITKRDKKENDKKLIEWIET
jgi:hypothetical protein